MLIYKEQLGGIIMKRKLINMGIGLVTGLVAGKFLESKCAKDLAVSATVGGIKIKEGFDKTLEDIRENAKDIYAEAKEKKEKCDKENKRKSCECNIEDLAKEAEKEDLAEEDK